MKSFKYILYEAFLYSFGKVLAKYNAFSQGMILKDVGKDIIEYFKKNGFDFEESGTMEDIPKMLEFFEKNGFSKIEITPAEKGDTYTWTDLYGIDAYYELQKYTENPFLSCPLNACVYFLADERGKALELHSKLFDLENKIVISNEEIVDKIESSIGKESKFDPLIIENKRLIELAENRYQALQESQKEIKTLKQFLPMCAKCRKIRDDEGYWERLENYITNHTDTKFSHGLCEECSTELYGEYFIKEDTIEPNRD